MDRKMTYVLHWRQAWPEYTTMMANKIDHEVEVKLANSKMMEAKAVIDYIRCLSKKG